MPRNQGTRIPIAQYVRIPLQNITNLGQVRVESKSEATSNKEIYKVFTTTPKSSRNVEAAYQPIVGSILMSPNAVKRTEMFSATHQFKKIINLNFSTINCTLAAPAANANPFWFGSSDQSSHPAIKKKIARTPSIQQKTSNVHQGQKAEKVAKTHVERHRQMYKRRFLRRKRVDELSGVRINRRFDLLMKFREDQRM